MPDDTGKRPWKVMDEMGRVRHFGTLRAAERYAHGYVAAALRSEGFSERCEIYRNGLRVGMVRMDNLGRTWTDVEATEHA